MNDLKEIPTKGKGSAARSGAYRPATQGIRGRGRRAHPQCGPRKYFWRRGFDGASIDEIAVAARAGKPTIYARFGDKRALFTAVVTRDVLSRIAQFHSEVPTEGTIEQRLARGDRLC